MRTFLISAAAVAAVAGFSASASAEPFNGPFVGVQAGWSQDKVGAVGTDAGRAAPRASKDAFVAGGFVGYDYKITPRVVVGAEAGINFGVDDKLYGVTGSNVTIDPKRSIDLTARAGYLVNDNTLIYARGGYSNVRVRTQIATVSASEDRDAWVVGGGVERAVTPNVSARLEYRYNGLSEGDGKWNRNQVLAGVSYHF